jgi:hypothetical protein
MNSFDLLDFGRVIGTEYLLMELRNYNIPCYCCVVFMYNCICLSPIKLCLSELSTAESKAWAQIAC